MGRRWKKFNHAQAVIARLDRAIQYAAAVIMKKPAAQHTGFPAGACHRAAIRPTRWQGMIPGGCVQFIAP